MRNDFYRGYLESEILNADPIKLICLLYTGAIERVAQARHCLRDRDIAGRSAAISKATAIVNQLMLSVDLERGGEIGRNLVELYDYIVRCLNQGNYTQADGPLGEAQLLLSQLSEAWEQCSRAGANRQDVEVYEPVSCAG